MPIKTTPLNQNKVKTLQSFSTPTVANAVGQLGVDPTSGFSYGGIRCHYPDLGPMVGVVMTVEIETLNPSVTNPGPGPIFFELLEAIRAEKSPVIIVGKEVGTGGYAAHCGEILASSMKRVGAVGLLTDGGVRDIEEVRALDFHFFSQGIVPSAGNARLVRLGGRVAVQGIEVSPGDILHADANGLVKIEEDQIDQVIRVATQVSAGEQRLLNFINGEDFSISGLRDLMTAGQG